MCHFFPVPLQAVHFIFIDPDATGLPKEIFFTMDLMLFNFPVPSHLIHFIIISPNEILTPTFRLIWVGFEPTTTPEAGLLYQTELPLFVITPLINMVEGRKIGVNIS